MNTTTQAYKVPVVPVDLGTVTVARETCGKLLVSFARATRGRGPGRWAETERGAKAVVGRWLREVARPGERAWVRVEWRLS